MENKDLPSPENPEKLLNLKSTGPKKWAAGVPAVVAALSDVMEEGIPFRGTRALFAMNQKGGFDCSSCAWPDPDDDRSPVGEYCENGAKALAEEATTKKVTAEFFAHNSVIDLANLTDFEIGKKGRKQDGDPEKAAALFIQLAENPAPSLHLWLGANALDRASEKIETMGQEPKKWKDLSVSADFK